MKFPKKTPVFNSRPDFALYALKSFAIEFLPVRNRSSISLVGDLSFIAGGIPEKAASSGVIA